jgi:hypothetical protein
MKEMQKTDKPFNIEERALDYTVRAVRLFRYLKAMRDDVESIVGRQYLRAATSIGANLVEARHGESRADFVHNTVSIFQMRFAWSRKPTAGPWALGVEAR